MIKGTFREFQKKVFSWRRGKGSYLIHITKLNAGGRMGIGYDYRKVWDRTWNWKYVLTLAGDVEIGGFIFLPLINTHFSQLSFPHVKWSNITSRAPPFPGAVLCTHTMYFVRHTYNLGIPGALGERYFTLVDIFSHIATLSNSCSRFLISFPFKIVATLKLKKIKKLAQ